MHLDRPLNLLVVGGGGREHALVWKLSQSQLVSRIFCAPGNGGTAGQAKSENVPIQVGDFKAIGEFCQKEKIDLVVVGPDNPLADGIVDFLLALNVPVFGPTKEQAKLEWSKAHAKEVMDRLKLPTARHAVCRSFDQAAAVVGSNHWARVVKVDGLALGKGVFVCDSAEEALDALSGIFNDKSFGTAGDTVVIEEKLVGEELSLLMLVDGKNLKVLEPSQDHKRRFDGDRGPNTGGMGAYSPVEIYNDCRQAIAREIVDPIARALQAGELDFRGVLYVGIMVRDSRPGASTSSLSQSSPLSSSQSSSHSSSQSSSSNLKPYILEFNARFGDPETQAILPRMKSDLLPALLACTQGNLNEIEIEWLKDSCCCVVAVAENYPQSSSKGEPISFGTLPDGCIVFHAGTKESGQLPESGVVTNGGRVLSVVALAPDMEAASDLSYQGLKSISFAGLDYRHDIGRRAFKPCLSG